jgi:hypothetical protein
MTVKGKQMPHYGPYREIIGASWDRVRVLIKVDTERDTGGDTGWELEGTLEPASIQHRK